MISKEDKEVAKSINITLVARSLGLDWREGKVHPCFKGHGIKTPSLSVKNNRFKCFSCFVSGDSIDLVRYFTGRNYIDSVNWLLESNYPKVSLSDSLSKTSSLKSSPSVVNIELDKALKKYNFFTEELSSYFSNRFISKRVVSDSSIFILPKDHDVYEFSKHRLIIPFTDFSGNVVAYQGRNIDGDNNGIPRYKFQKIYDSPFFFKYPNVFHLGINFDSLVLTEGAIDGLSMVQLGFQNILSLPSASYGLRHLFENEGLNLLSSAKMIILAFDNDSAGHLLFEKFRNLFVNSDLIRSGCEVYTVDWSSLKLAGCKDINSYLAMSSKDLNYNFLHYDFSDLIPLTKFSFFSMELEEMKRSSFWKRDLG